MFSLRTASLPVLRSALLSATSATLLLTTGCANNFLTTATRNTEATSAGSLAGAVHGGQQPIAGSTISLYAAGTTGYGTGSTLLGTAVTTDETGHFTYGAYTCPSSNAPVYLISSGGYTNGTFGTQGATANSAAVLMAAIGPCGASSALTNVVISEVTTVASVFALAQYINPGTTAGTETIGGPGDYTAAAPLPQAATGILNAANNVPLLANIGTGLAVTSTAIAPGTKAAVAAVTVTATPEQAKINSIANILAACVNNSTSAGPQCATLFSNATPPSPAVTSQPSATFSTAVDTLQAAYYMATNPTDGSPTKLNNLYTNTSGAAPFQPTLSAVPTDWTLGLSFTSNTTACTNAALFINYPYEMSVDSGGNIWLSNGGNAGTAVATTQMGPNGQALNCSDPIIKSRGGAAIDTAGNVWSASNTTAAVYKFDGTTTTTIPTAAVPYAITTDGAGYIFYTQPSPLGVFRLPATATASTTPTSIGAVTSNSPYGLKVDSKGTVLIGQSGSGGATISATAPTTVGGTTYSTPSALTSSTNFAGVYEFAVDASGNFWVSNSAGGSSGSASASSTGPGNTTSYVTPTYSSATPGATNTVTFAESTPTPVFAGGLSTARGVAIDGAGNVWFSNNTAASSNLYAVSEFTSAGVALSPTSVTTGTNAGGFTTATQNGGFQKPLAFFNSLRGMAIDPSGNVWTSSTSSTTTGLITELIGAAVPVVTPISRQLSAKTGPTKP